MLQFGNSVGVSESGGVVLLELEGSDSVVNSSVGGRTICDGVVSVENEQAVTAAPEPITAIAASARKATRPHRVRYSPRDPYPCIVSTPKIVLFYVFTPLPDPDAIRLWQQAICESLGLRGRIIVSRHGINGTVGGELADVKRYVRVTRGYRAFADADIRWAEGTGDDFPRLSVRVRPEIVTFGTPDELLVDDSGVVGGGTRLNPQDLHRLVAERGQDVVFFDGRNRIESQIGRFAGAITPDVETTRDFVPLIESGAYDHLKDRPVVTYCTGGVRCEVLTALMRNRGFGEVYQLDGGIVRYGEEFGDDGLWEGSLYVFDKRMSVDFSDHPVVLATCVECGTPTSNVANHPDRLGRDLAVLCSGCVDPGPA